MRWLVVVLLACSLSGCCVYRYLHCGTDQRMAREGQCG